MSPLNCFLRFAPITHRLRLCSSPEVSVDVNCGCEFGIGLRAFNDLAWKFFLSITKCDHTSEFYQFGDSNVWEAASNLRAFKKFIEVVLELLLILGFH